MKNSRIIKKTIGYILVALLLITMLTIYFFPSRTTFAYAQTTEVVQEDVVEETTQEPVVENTTPTETITIWTRVEEWFSQNFVEFISSSDLIATLFMAIATIVGTRLNKKYKKGLGDTLAENSKIVNSNTQSNDKVLEVVNELIEKHNQHELKEIERDKLMEQSLAFGKAIMEMLVAVYANNKNLPQGTKDLVVLRCVQALQGKAPETLKEVIPELATTEDKETEG